MRHRLANWVVATISIMIVLGIVLVAVFQSSQVAM